MSHGLCSKNKRCKYSDSGDYAKKKGLIEAFYLNSTLRLIFLREPGYQQFQLLFEQLCERLAPVMDIVLRIWEHRLR